MKLLIVGSRSIESFDIDKYIPEGVDLIISGGAAGIDSIAEKYADKHGISKLILRPRYDLYGRAAPIRRNEEMINLADEVLAVWDGRSRGTLYTISRCEKSGVSLRVIDLSKESSSL